MGNSSKAPENEEPKSYESITVLDGCIDASPVDAPWYTGLVFERTGPDRDNSGHWVAHLTLGNSTIHMPMIVFLTLKRILGEIKV